MSKYTDSYRVRVGDADKNGLLKAPSLLGMLQEAANDHAEALEIGATNLNPMGLGWALYKLFVKISRMPSRGEMVSVKTWPSVRNKIYTEREFVLSDDLGDTVACARTQWVLFDLKKRRLERLDVLGQWPQTEEFPCDFVFSNSLKAPDAEKAFKSNFGVRKDDIDMNGHVNNSVYLTWALEPVPDEFTDRKRPAELELAYISEVFRGQRLDSICEMRGGESLHSVVSEGKERVRARVSWADV